MWKIRNLNIKSISNSRSSYSAAIRRPEAAGRKGLHGRGQTKTGKSWTTGEQFAQLRHKKT